jgi:D-alanyl-D-alanine carboxypeptidase (penicillin-binding protein 5/6)
VAEAGGPPPPTVERRPRWRVWLGRSTGFVSGLAVGLAVGLGLGAVELGDEARPGVAGGAPAERKEQHASARDRALRRDLRASSVSPVVADPLAVTLEDEPAAGIVMDVETGRTLWESDVREERPIASLAKIMTALLVVDELTEPGRRVTIGSDAVGAAGTGDVTGSAIGLEEDMRVKVAALFQSMLIASHNDAATALAVQAAGSEDRFVARMNHRAESLGLDCTHFVSAHGFEPENRSCALDLAAMTRLAMRERRIRSVARRERAVVDFPADGGRRHLDTTNPLIETDYRGTIGLKTGYTEQAGRSLAGVVSRGDRTLAAILLDSPNPEGQARLLLDAAFSRSKEGDRADGLARPPGDVTARASARTGAP